MASEASSSSNAIITWYLYMGVDGEAVPMDVTHLRVHHSVTVIPEDAFEGREKLQQVELPVGLRKIGAGAFSGCQRLENVDLPDGLQEIGEAAFYLCRSLPRSIKIPPNIRVIPEEAFLECRSLTEVDLPEGLREIGKRAFHACYSLERINFPSTLKVICKEAFHLTFLSSIDLPDGVERIGKTVFGGHALWGNKVLKMRIPPLINFIPKWALRHCESMFSLELPEGVNQICDGALLECRHLRNLAIPPNAEIDEGDFSFVLDDCWDLSRLFDSSGLTCKESNTRVKDALMHRFDGLPIHKICYYQSYHPTETTLNRLSEAINVRTGQSGNQRDCLGMTPLHILACSTKQSLELYQLLIEKFPQDLITEDRWVAVPLLYALWGRAPGEVIQFLADSHKTNFPRHVLNWGEMVETLGVADAPLDVLKNLVDTQQTHFPEQRIDWVNLVDDFASPLEDWGDNQTEIGAFRFSIWRSISDRVSSIGLKQWRDDIMNMIESVPRVTDDSPDDDPESTNTREAHLDRIRSTLARYECEFCSLKEGTTMLELALWRAKINESIPANLNSIEERRTKKAKIDQSAIRNQCRISCGADHVIENVLPYLLPAAEEKNKGSVGNGAEGEESDDEEDSSSDEEEDASDDDDIEEEPLFDPPP